MLPADGRVLTVTTAVAAAVPQLLVTVHEIVVVPVETPVTRPSVPIVATTVFVLDHTPPPVTSESEIEALVQTEVAPLILPADGVGLTVIIAVAATVPQL